MTASVPLGLFLLASAVAVAALGGVLVLARQVRRAQQDAARAALAAEQERQGRIHERSRRRRFERALRAIPAGVVVVDEVGTVVFRNEVATEFAQARHGEALVEAAVQELVAQAGRGEIVERTVELFGPPRRTIVVTARPLKRRGTPVGALAVVEDVTERRRLEAIRRDFVANISHELKTPVGALSLLAETLLDEADPDVTRRLAGRMVDESIRLANTIDDLLVLSRIEAEEEPAHEPVFVSQVVQESIERIAPAADQAGITVVGPPDDRRAAIVGDRRQLVSAVSNLLDNAVKYSDAGSSVEVHVDVVGDVVEIAVEDHGIGIPARDHERVFERFYRVDVARSRQTGGTGLGLSIVRHVLENHQGELRLESRLGEGSRFTLCLPLLAAGPLAAVEPPPDPDPDGRTSDQERDAG